MKEYLELLQFVKNNGRYKEDRTGVGTLSYFGGEVRYDLSKGFPLLTTKRVHFKSIAHELLWFLSGSVNIQPLVQQGVRIWNEWPYDRYTKTMQKTGKSTSILVLDDFIEKIKTDDAFAKEWGDLGFGTYGSMWRDYPFHTKIPESAIPMLGSVDQISKVVNDLVKSPDSRRLIVNAWHPGYVDHVALPPCHCFFQFYTVLLTNEERNQLVFNAPYDQYNTQFTGMAYPLSDADLDAIEVPKRRLDCKLHQRSADLLLGVPFNIASYSLLIHLIGASINYAPGYFIHSLGDAHIYSNHFEQVEEQLSRDTRPLPHLRIKSKVWKRTHFVRKSILEYTYDDIVLENYNPHPSIKAPVAV